MANKKLFVGGLSWDTTDATLGAFFAQAGSVVSANVIIDRYSGKSKGFGFVEMSSEDEAAKAQQELNGQSLDGRAIAVSEALPPKPRDSYSGGGNSGGGYGGGRRDDRYGNDRRGGGRDDRRGGGGDRY